MNGTQLMSFSSPPLHDEKLPVPAPAGTLGELLLHRLTQEKDPAKKTNAFLTLNAFAEQLSYRERMHFIETCVEQLSLAIAINEKLREDPEVVKIIGPVADEQLTVFQKVFAAFTASDAIYHQEEKEIRAVWNSEQPLAEKLAAIGEIRKKYADASQEPGQSYAEAKKRLKILLKALHQALQDIITRQPQLLSEQIEEWEVIIRQLLTVPVDDEKLSDIPPVQKGSSIWDAHVVQMAGPIDPNNKAELLPHLSPNMADYRCISPKRGGANNPGEYGGNYLGVYLDASGNLQVQTIFFKQATDDEINHRENIAEVVSGRIMRAVVGNNSAATLFAIRPQPLADAKEENTYVGSIYYDRFTDVTSLKGKKKRGRGTDTSRQMHVTARELAYGGYTLNGELLGPVPGLGKVLGSSLLVGNYQFHTDNTALALVGDHYEFVGIDYGGAFRRNFFSPLPGTKRELSTAFSRAIHPHSKVRRKQRTHYIDSYPIDVRMSQNFITELGSITTSSRTQLQQAVVTAVDDTLQHYSLDTVIRHFAEELDPQDQELKLAACATAEQKIVAIKKMLSDRMLARQFSLAEYQMELTLSAYVEQDRLRQKREEKEALSAVEQKYAPHLARPDLAKLIRENPIYFLTGRYHFRGKGQALNQEPHTTQIKTLYAEVMTSDELSGIEKLLATGLEILKNVPKNKAQRTKNMTTCMLARLEMMYQLAQHLYSGQDDPQLTADSLEILTLINYLKNALSGNYDFNKLDDRNILLQACNAAYQQIIKTYQHCIRLYPSLEPHILSALRIGGKPRALHEQTVYLTGLQHLAQPHVITQRLENIGQRREQSLQKILMRDLLDEKRYEQALESFFDILSYFEKSAQQVVLKEISKIFDIAVADLPFAVIIAQLKSHALIHDEQIWQTIFAIIPTDPLSHNNLFAQPVSQINVHQPRQEDLRRHMSRDLTHYRYIAPKGSSGAQDAGPLGGWYVGCYQTPDGRVHAQRFMIKRESRACKNIVESVCGRLKSLLVNEEKDYTACTYLVRDPYAAAHGTNTYAVSIALDGFQEMHQVAGLESRVRFAGTRSLLSEEKAAQVFTTIRDLHEEEKYDGLEEVFMADWWTEDSDAHSGNVGASAKLRRFLGIDNAAGLLELEAKIHPHRHGVWENVKRFCRRHPEPTYHMHEYPSDLRISATMAARIAKHTARITYADIARVVDEEIDAAVLHYQDDPNTFKKFALRLGIAAEKLTGNNLIVLANTTKSFLKEIMYARLLSLRKFGKEIEMSLCFQWDPQQGFTIPDSRRLADFIQKNPNYCLQGNFHFRGKSGKKKRGGYFYHIFGNYLGRGNQLDRMLRERTQAILNKTEPLGIQKFLSQDFMINNITQRARGYANRLKIIKMILEQHAIFASHPLQNRIDDIIAFLQRYAGRIPRNSKENRNSHLIQLCDYAYTTIKQVFELLPINLAKLQIYEVFQQLDADPAQLKNYDAAKLAACLASFSVHDAAFTHAVVETAGQLEALSRKVPRHPGYRYQVEGLKRTVQATRFAVSELSSLTEPAAPTLATAEQQLAAAHANLSQPLREHEEKEYLVQPVSMDSRQLAEVTTSLGVEQETQPAQTELRAEESVTYVGHAPTADRAVMLPHPWLRQAKPRIGSVVKVEYCAVTVCETKEKDPELSPVSLLVNMLTQHMDANERRQKIPGIRRFIQENYIRLIESRGEFVTVDNLLTHLINPLLESDLGLRLPKNQSGFFGGMFAKKDFVKQMHAEYMRKMHWNPKLLFMAHVWFETAMTNVNCTINNIKIRGASCSEFTKILFIYAVARGADLSRINYSDYRYVPSKEEVEKMRLAIDDPHSSLHKEMMKYAPEDYRQKTQQIVHRAEAMTTTFLPDEVLTWVKRTQQHLGQFASFASFTLEQVNIALQKLEQDKLTLEKFNPNNKEVQALMHSLQVRIDDARVRLQSVQPLRK